MMKSISIAALALAMTAGVASAQSTTPNQRGAGAFDQGGVFQAQPNTPAPEPMIDTESTGSILPNFGGGADAPVSRDQTMPNSEASPAAPATEVPSSTDNGIDFGGRSPFYEGN